MKVKNKRLNNKLNIRKDDMVLVLAGKDKGATGKVLKVFPDKMKILVEGVNIFKKHSKPDQNNQQGGIVDKAMPIDYSNVQLLDSDGNATRVRIEIIKDEDGKIVSKNRIAVKNGKQI